MRLCRNPVIASARHKFWIDAADFEFFKSGGDGNTEGARVLIQRGTRLNPLSKELWLQCFDLDLSRLTLICGLFPFDSMKDIADDLNDGIF